VRLASRRLYGPLLRAGVRIFEYEPGMTHVKALIVDGLWSVIGTTNIDNRSFEHNDEVNVVVRDAKIVSRVMVDLEADMAASTEIAADGWKRGRCGKSSSARSRGFSSDNSNSW
jgi:cardiolipin synthase